MVYLALLVFMVPQDKEKIVTRELQEKINASISKGVKFLKTRVASAGSPQDKRLFSEKRPLIGLAMLKGGTDKKDPSLQAIKRDALAIVTARFQGVDRFSQVYLAGIIAMFLTEFDEAATKKALQDIVDMVAASQLAGGSWGYTVTKPDDRDNVSCAQYALLALQAAANRGCKIPEATVVKAARYFVSAQTSANEGGWTYHGNLAREKPHGSVTAIGVAALIICKSNLTPQHELLPKIDPAVQRGIEWLAKNFAVASHPGKQPWQTHKDALWLYYYLYSLERVGMFARIDQVGTHAWYAEGAEFLVGKQRPNGTWEETHEKNEDDDLATCFAVLFLARASDGFIPTSSGK